MSDPQSWPRIAVVGAGAVGGYFGGRLAQAAAPVVLIGRQAFVDAVNAHRLIIEEPAGGQAIEVEATADIGAVADAEVVLFCVKSNDTVSTAREIAPLLAPNALVICLQNGVDNVERIRDATKIDALPAAVYIGVSVPEPGRIRYAARGDLILGPENDKTRWAQQIFKRANIVCRLTNNIEGEMWLKLLCNSALNAISALGHARYGEIAKNVEARKLMQNVVDEVIAVAHAAGVRMAGVEDSDSGLGAAMQIATQVKEAFSSTAQDIQRGKPTEIDSLNGYIVRRGAELGIEVPLNHALFTLVKMREGKSG